MKEQKRRVIPRMRVILMTRVVAGLAMAGVVVALVLTASRQRHSDRLRSRVAAVQQLTDSALSESEIRDRDISFYERRAAEDRRGSARRR